MSEAPVQKTLWQKLLEVQKAVTYLQRNAQSKAGGSYTYVSSALVLERIRGEMDEQGLLLQTATVEERLHIDAAYSYADKKQHFTEVVMEFTWINTDNPEETMVCRWYGQGIDNGEKGPGKAMTYAEKYFLLKFFHIATGDHDDPDAGREEPEPAPDRDEKGRPLTQVGLAAFMEERGVPRKYVPKAAASLDMSIDTISTWAAPDLQKVGARALKMYEADQADAEVTAAEEAVV